MTAATPRPLSDLRRLLEDALFTRDLTLREAATQTGISPATLHRVLRGIGITDTKHLLAIAKWVGCDVVLVPRPKEGRP